MTDFKDVPDRESTAEPVFLVGCHRSGTTLVRYLLDSHPHLACPPESKFIGGIEAFLAYPQALQGLAHLGVSPDRVRDELRDMIGKVFGEFAARQGKRRWVDKTPNYFRVLPLIDWLFSKTVSYLFVARHPLDTIDSLERSPYFAADVLEDPDILSALQRYGRSRAGWAKYWVEVNNCIASFEATCPSRCHSFRYEDLVSTPEPVLADVLGFIGEELPTGLIENAFAQRHTCGYADWKIRGAAGIHQASLDKWRAWPPSEITAVWEIVGPLAKTLGYADPIRLSQEQHRA